MHLRSPKWLLCFIVSVGMLTCVHGNGASAVGSDRLPLDLPLKMLLTKPMLGKAITGKALAQEGTASVIDVLMKSSNVAATREAVAMLSGTVRSEMGSILTATLPLSRVTLLARQPEIVKLEVSRPLNLLMDSARLAENTNVESVQSQYDGTNVVVGIIDSGLDYANEDFGKTSGGTRVQYARFQSVTSTGTVSILECAKDYLDSGECAASTTNDSTIGHGTHVAGIAASGDGTYTGIAPAADLMLVRNDYAEDIDEGGAQSGTFSGGIIDGVVEIFKKSDILDKPAVINISQGTHVGAHDDTSLMEEAIDAAVTGGYATNGKSYGRAVVAAAGNESVVANSIGALANFAGGIHASFSVPVNTSHAYRLWVLMAEAPQRTPLIGDIWFGSGQKANCSVAANAYRYSDVFKGTDFSPADTRSTDNARAWISDLPLSTDNDGTDSQASGSVPVAITMAVDSEDAQNGRPRALLLYGPSSTGTWDNIALYDNNSPPSLQSGAYVLDVILRAGSGGACSGDMWLDGTGGGTFIALMKGIDTGAFDVSSGTHGAGYALQSGDSEKIVAIPATASGAIGVGAYLQYKPASGCPSQSCWRDIDGNLHDATDPTAADAVQAQVNGGTVGKRTPFSSIGPAVYAYSGRKPDVMAPGDPMISTRASGFTPSFGGSEDRMLEADDNHVKLQGTSQASPVVAGIVALLFQKNNRLTAAEAKNALTSTATLNDSQEEAGYGDVNAAAALASVSSDTSGYSGTGNLTQAQVDGGGGGSTSSGCGATLLPNAPSSGISAIVLALVPILAIAWRRARVRHPSV